MHLPLPVFSPYTEEIGIKDRRIDTYFNNPSLVDAYKELVTDYYGCYGDVLEVAIAPTQGPEKTSPKRRFNDTRMMVPKNEVHNKRITEYPYFANFEPKKRELYETVSESGEIVSRTLEDVGVMKGSSTSNSAEVLDGNTQAAKTEAGLKIMGMGATSGFSASSESGRKNINQKDMTDVRSTDTTREKRETLPYYFSYPNVPSIQQLSYRHQSCPLFYASSASHNSIR